MLQRRARGWFCGFRLAVKTDLGSRIVRARSIVQGAVNEHEIAEDLSATCPKRIATPRSSPWPLATALGLPLEIVRACAESTEALSA